MRLRRRLRIFRMVAEKSRDGLLLQHHDATILWCNQAYCDLLGRPRDFWIGKKPQKWVIPPEICPSDAEIEAFRFDQGGQDFQELPTMQNIRADGSRFWAQMSLSYVQRRRQDPLVVLSIRDVTEQVERAEALTEAKAELERAVNHDALTGLANRRKLVAHLDRALGQARVAGRRIGLIHVDLDKFKGINDTHGHAAGDAVLMAAAKALSEGLGKGDLAARIGGDEFILVLQSATTPDALERAAERLLKAVAQPVVWEDRRLHYGASLGLVMSDPATQSGEELVQCADFALYEVKARGRGDYAIYDGSLLRKQRDQQELADDLTEAVRGGDLHFHFQPIVDQAARSVVGIETLTRWHHADRGLTMPAKFLPTAQEIGLVEELDFAAMRAAFRAHDRLRQAGHAGLGVSFNASFQTLANTELVGRLTWEADARDVPHHELTVEILETVLVTEGVKDAQIVQQIGALSQAGFGTMLDDFGTGYAGLAHLARLQVGGIKIDHSLVNTMLTDQSSDVIVRSVLSLAQELGLEVIAEGVEAAEIAERLVAMGCRKMQGFGIARPMRLGAVLDWIPSYEAGEVALATGETRLRRRMGGKTR